MRKLLLLSTLLLLFVLPVMSRANLYQWQDKDGGWHIADDIEKVPSEYRKQMKTEKTPEAAENPVPKVGKTASPKDREKKDESIEKIVESIEKLLEDKPAPKKYRIPYKQSPGVMYVKVSLNGHTPIPLILDTGATFTVLSRETAEELGISLKGVLPMTRTSTANGVIENYMVRLSSVQLGDARVENIAALVPVRGEIGVNGLLGQNFLNEFEWSNDTTLSVLTLREPSSLPGEETFGGHDRRWWEKKFKTVKANLGNEQNILKMAKDYDPDGPMEEDSVNAQIRIQKATVEFFQKELELLDTKANRLMVPRSWR
jgi:clan AA aspartic protease (TIGR02281 family)